MIVASIDKFASSGKNLMCSSIDDRFPISLAFSFCSFLSFHFRWNDIRNGEAHTTHGRAVNFQVFCRSFHAVSAHAFFFYFSLTITQNINPRPMSLLAMLISHRRFSVLSLCWLPNSIYICILIKTKFESTNLYSSIIFPFFIVTSLSFQLSLVWDEIHIILNRD